MKKEKYLLIVSSSTVLNLTGAMGYIEKGDPIHTAIYF